MKIVLGVTGGIAAYKAAALTSTLVQRGATVDVIMTDDAQRFIAPLTFAALSHRPVATSLWEAPQRIAHIELARTADCIVIAPATANIVAKLAFGIADDLLTTVALAAQVPIILAPAMNWAMYENAATQQNLATLRSRGYEIIDPESGFLAEREQGIGRLASEEAIIATVERVVGRKAQLRGRRFLITAGPTREALDPVRFLSNPSTGTMGLELAREAAARGADVDVILGPTDASVPTNVRVARVTSAQEMYDATLARAPGADVAIAAAAVSDWRPRERAEHKIKKTDAAESLELVRTPDILAELGAAKNGTFVVGFAAETEQHEANAREKLRKKHLDAIAVNDVGGANGFGTGENALVLLWGEHGRTDLGRSSKAQLAANLLDAIEELRLKGTRCS